MAKDSETSADNLTAQVLDPKDLVNYQDGSVVSRTIAKKSTGMITLFAFDQGQTLSEHTSPYDAMVQVLEGEAELTVEGKPFHLLAGQLLIMPADKPHAVAATKRFKMLLTMLHS